MLFHWGWKNPVQGGPPNFQIEEKGDKTPWELIANNWRTDSIRWFQCKYDQSFLLRNVLAADFEEGDWRLGKLVLIEK